MQTGGLNDILDLMPENFSIVFITMCGSKYLHLLLMKKLNIVNPKLVT